MTRNVVSSTASDLRNALFANHARRFVNRVARLPGLPILLAGGAVGIVLMTTVGAFGTGTMQLATRAGFWLALIGWNVAKSQAWFTWLVRKPSDWMAASLTGAIALNLPLPLEIAGALRLFGLAGARSPPLVQIKGGTELPVSARYLPVVRGAGWLHRPL